MIVTRREAKEKQLSRYFTGKPCLKGHISERITYNGECYTCRKERGPASTHQENVKSYKQRNSDKIKSYQKEYQQRLEVKAKRAASQKNREYIKNNTSCMEALLVKNMINRSIPIPIPDVGGIPYSSARRKSSSIN